jgi:hypothetical protein
MQWFIARPSAKPPHLNLVTCTWINHEKTKLLRDKFDIHVSFGIIHLRVVSLCGQDKVLWFVDSR